MKGVYTGDCIELDQEDIHLLQEKRHPVQQEAIRDLPEGNKEDLFALPLPFMAAVQTATSFYAKGTGKYGKGYAEGQWKVDPNDPWFWCHFVRDPVMPGSLGTDGLFQLAGIWGAFTRKIQGRPRALEGKFTYDGQIFPNAQCVYYRIDVSRFLKNRRLMQFDGQIAVDDPENVIYRYEGCKMGYFFREELGIPEGPASTYYSPDWETCRVKALESVQSSQRLSEASDASNLS